MSIVKKIIRDYLIPILCAAILAFFINKLFLFKIYIPSESMVPTLKIGDQAFVTRIYNKDKIKRGDILVFQSDELGELLIKRAIGLPGDKVNIDENGDVFINGQKIDEPYVVNKSNMSKSFDVIPKDCYLFLGDNRANSNDSRYWQNPFINAKNIKGKAQIIVFPFKRFGKIK